MALGADFGLAYEQKKRTAGTQRDSTLAMNAYSRFLSQTRGTRDLTDLNRTQTEGLGKLGSSFAHRGLGYSGVYQAGQQEYGRNWLQQQQDITDGVTNTNRQYDLQDAQAYGNYDSTVADLELDKQSRIAADAAALDGMRPFL